MFGEIEHAIIRNITMINASIIGGSGTGCIVGSSWDSIIENCVVYGSVTGIDSVGGIIGLATIYSTVTNCTNHASVNGEENVGGIAGSINHITLSSCQNYGNINGIEKVGGLFGSGNGYVTICENNGKVSGEYYCGGISGEYGYTLTDCYNTGNISGIARIGGLLGLCTHQLLINCYSTGNVTGSVEVGGLVYRDNPILDNSFYNADTAVIIGEDANEYGALSGELFDAWLANDLVLNPIDFLSFDGQDYLINNETEFDCLTILGAMDDARYKLTSDLDFSGQNNYMIPIFKGSLNGNGHTISNLTIDNPVDEYIGLFRNLLNAEITNLNLESIRIFDGAHVGSLAGCAENSTIINCDVTADIDDTVFSVGGFIGSISDSEITNSTFTGSIYAQSGVTGGIVGSALENSAIINCEATLEFLRGRCLGGITGYNANSHILNCNVTGNVYGYDGPTGGLVGKNVEDGIIESCYANIVINDDSPICGGLVGENFGTISNCHVSGTVNGENKVGGLLGLAEKGAVVNCTSTCDVNGITIVGGLIGLVADCNIEDSFYNIDTVLINNEHRLTVCGLPTPLYNEWISGVGLDIDSYLMQTDGRYHIETVDDLKLLNYFGQYDYDLSLLTIWI